MAFIWSLSIVKDYCCFYIRFLLLLSFSCSSRRAEYGSYSEDIDYKFFISEDFLASFSGYCLDLSVIYMDTDFDGLRIIDGDLVNNAGLMTVDFRSRPPNEVLLFPITVSCEECFLFIMIVLVL